MNAGRRAILRILIFVTTWVALPATNAFGSALVAASAAARVIDATRLEERVASLPWEMMRPVAARLLASGHRAQSRELRAIISESIRPENIRGRAIRQLVQEATVEDLSALGAWFASPLAHRISSAEVQASEPRSASRFLVFLRALGSQPPTARRAALVRELERATRATDNRVRRFERTVDLLLRAAGRPASVRLDEAARAAAARRVIATLLFTYRDLSDDELAEYLRFQQFRSAGALRAVTDAAMDGCMDDAVQRAAPRIIVVLHETAALNASGPKD